MAKASVTTTTVSTYTLELSFEEARLLRHVLDNIGGESDGPRGVTDGISKSLDSVGIESTYSLDWSEGAIYMVDEIYDYEESPNV